MGELTEVVASMMHRGPNSGANHSGAFKDQYELLVEPSPGYHDGVISFDSSYTPGVPYDDGFYESESSLTSPHSESHFSTSEGTYGLYDQMPATNDFYSANEVTSISAAPAYSSNPHPSQSVAYGSQNDLNTHWQGHTGVVHQSWQNNASVHSNASGHPGTPSSGSEEARSDSEDTIEHFANLGYSMMPTATPQRSLSANFASPVAHATPSPAHAGRNAAIHASPNASPHVPHPSGFYSPPATTQFAASPVAASGRASPSNASPRTSGSGSGAQSKPRAKRAKLDETQNSSPHLVSLPSAPASAPVSSATMTFASASALGAQPKTGGANATSNTNNGTSSPPNGTSSSPAPSNTRVRRSAMLAAKAIKVEMMDSFEPSMDDDDVEVAPGANGSHRKRKRGEQQKAKHNVAEKRRRVEMNDAMDRIKACLSQGDRVDDSRGNPTKVSILLETADHMETLQRENERLKQQCQALSSRVQLLETEVAHYRGESTDDTTSLVSSPGTERGSPRSRLAISVTSTMLLTILFCMAWSPAQNMIHNHIPDSVGLSRKLMEMAEASSWELFFRVIHLITENVLPTITFVMSLMFTLYLYSVFMRPVIRDKDIIAAHIETVTAIHGARVLSGKAAWVKALKLSQDLGIKPPSALMAIPHIFYELLRWVAVQLWLGVFAERAVYFLRGVTPEQLDKNAELEVSLIQCLVELCPDADWSIAAVMLKALNLSAVSPNRRFVNGESVVPLYKVKLWAFGAQRLLTHFYWPYRLLAWHCVRRMKRFSNKADLQPVVTAKDSKLVVDIGSSAVRAKNRGNAPHESPEAILGANLSNPANASQTPRNKNSSNAHTPRGPLDAFDEVSSESSDDTTTTSTDSVQSNLISTNPTYIVSTQDDAALFNVMMPDTEQKAAGDSTTSKDTIPDSRRSIETTYRSVCLVHEIAAHMLAGRMDTADVALTELIAIRSQNLPTISRVSLDRLHTTHMLPFTRWGTLRTQLLRSLVSGIQGKYRDAVEIALFVQREAESTGDIETRCAAVLHSTQFLLLAGHIEAAANQLSELLLDPQTGSVLMSDAQHYSALRATWILLEENDTSRDRVVDGVDFVFDDRFIVELKHFVNGLEMRRDHRFETLYYLLCVVEAALNAWQRMDAVIHESPSPLATDSPIIAAKRAMLLDQRASSFLNLKVLTRRALDLLGKASDTGAFFLPAYHFFTAKMMLLSQPQSSSIKRVERELAAAVKTAWQLGRWDHASLEQSIQELHYDLIRPLIQVENEDNATTDLDEPPTARTCS